MPLKSNAVQMLRRRGIAGGTKLHEAAAQGDLDKVKLLVEEYTDDQINWLDSSGDQALCNAIIGLSF